MFAKWVRLTSGVRYGVDGETIPGVPNSSPSNVGIIEAKSVGNNSYYINAWAYDKGYGFQSASLSDGSSDGIYVGSGTSPEDEDDYTLESVITSGLEGNVVRSYVYDNDGNLIVRYTLTITNNSESDITIAEIGRVCKCPTSSTLGGGLSTSAAYRKAFLIDRTLLDAPLTLAPNESGVITYDMFVYEPPVEPEP